MIYQKYILAVLLLVGEQIVKYNCAFNTVYEDSVRRRTFFECIDKFETMEVHRLTISESDKKSMLENLDRGLPMTDIKSYLDKTFTLKCAYDFATLCMMYHVKQMFDDNHIRSEDLKRTLSQYSKNMHRIILITYMLKGPIIGASLFVAIYIDALLNGFDQFGNKYLNNIFNKLMGGLSDCYKDGKIDKRFVQPKYLRETDLRAQNSKLLSRLRLSADSEGVLLNLFGTEDRFDVYHFFFSKKHLNEKFAPPKVWFETFENSVLESVYYDVKDSWKTDSFALCRYTNKIKDLVLMTTYYALLKHCRFLLATWYILVERVKLSESSLQPSMREERKTLMRIPLSLIRIIFINLNNSLDVSFLPIVEAHLNNDESANKTKFTGFAIQVLENYNYYATKVRASQLSYDDWLGRDEFKIQSLFLYKDPNTPSFQSAIMENVKILQTYYEVVIETLSPTDFTAIDYFSLLHEKKNLNRNL